MNYGTEQVGQGQAKTESLSPMLVRITDDLDEINKRREGTIMDIKNKLGSIAPFRVLPDDDMIKQAPKEKSPVSNFASAMEGHIDLMRRHNQLLEQIYAHLCQIT